MPTLIENDDKKYTILNVLSDIKEFTSKACKLTNHCVNIIFKICTITKKHGILICKAISDEVVKDILKYE